MTDFLKNKADNIECEPFPILIFGCIKAYEVKI